MKTFVAEYAGGSSLSRGEAKPACAGRGEGGGEYAGGSRRFRGNEDGPDETLNYKLTVSIAHMRVKTRETCLETQDLTHEERHRLRKYVLAKWALY